MCDGSGSTFRSPSQWPLWHKVFVQCPLSFIVHVRDSCLSGVDGNRLLEIHEGCSLPHGDDGNVSLSAPSGSVLQPRLIGRVASGIHDTSLQINTKRDADILKSLYSNVVFSGGTTMFQGSCEHMTKEMARKNQGWSEG